MLPIGYLGPRPGLGDARQTRFTHDEQRTLLTLWAMLRSPLMMGGDLPHTDDWTASLLTNPEVLAVNQHSTGNQPLITSNTVVVWTARPETGGNRYLAVFNRADEEWGVALHWNELGLVAGRSYKLRDLWEHKDLEPANSLKVTLKPHASVLYLVSE